MASHLEQPQRLSTAEEVKMHCVKQQEFMQMKSGYKKEIANARACIDCKTIFVIELFLTQSFHFKVVSPPNLNEHASSSRAQVNPLKMMMDAQKTSLFSAVVKRRSNVCQP